MGIKFDFQYKGSSPLGEIYRPIAKVSIKSPNDEDWTLVWMIVDTGADFSILPNHLSADFGISLDDDCWKDTIKGVGGEQTIFLCKKRFHAKINNVERHIPIAFFNNDEVPPLMGRLGFIETFDTEFLKNRAVVFKP